MKSLLSIVAPIAAFVMVLFAIVWLYMYFGLHLPPTPQPPQTGGMTAFIVDDPPRVAPDMTFKRSDGKTFRLADFKGKVVLVNFWASWCAPCVRELPTLERLAEGFSADNFVFLPINVDRNGVKAARPFLENLGLGNLPLYLDRKMALAEALGVKSLPTSYLIDQRGRIVGGLTGYAEWNSPEAEALVNFYVVLEQ